MIQEGEKSKMICKVKDGKTMSKISLPVLQESNFMLGPCLVDAVALCGSSFHERLIGSVLS